MGTVIRVPTGILGRYCASVDKIQLEVRVRELVDAVVAGGKIEDDRVEAKGKWPDPKNAVQLAGSANAAGGHPIILIIGLGETKNEVVPLNNTEPSTWWSATEAEFVFGVAPRLLNHIRVRTDHGPVIALEFATDQAPYMVKNENGGWAKVGVPWRSAGSTHAATRAELLSILHAKAIVPPIAVVRSDVSLSSSVEAKIPPDKSHLSFSALLLIDSQPGEHIFFPAYRQQVTLRSSHGHEVDCSAAKWVTSAPMLPPSDPNNEFEAKFPRPKQFNQHGATDSPSGLVMTAPDIVRMELTAYVDPAFGQSMSEADWVELVAVLPIGASDQQARLRERLPRTAHHREATSEWGGPIRVTSWAAGYVRRIRPGSQQDVEVRMPGE